MDVLIILVVIGWFAISAVSKAKKNMPVNKPVIPQQPQYTEQAYSEELQETEGDAIPADSMSYDSSEGQSAYDMNASTQGRDSADTTEGECVHEEYAHSEIAQTITATVTDSTLRSRHISNAGETADKRFMQSDMTREQPDASYEVRRQEKAYDIADAKPAQKRFEMLEAKQMVIAAEILKRPRPGVAPRLR